MNPVQVSPEQQQRLIAAAIQARQKAYAPYSGYQVGSAVLAEDGTIFAGCNVENVTYGATICAERTAVVKAVSEGARRLLAVVVVTANGVTPCGICRQVLSEFGPDILVLTADPDGHLLHTYTLRELLPEAFTPEHLR